MWVSCVILGLLSSLPTPAVEDRSCDEPQAVRGEVTKPEAVSTPAPRFRRRELLGFVPRGVWVDAVITCKGRVVEPRFEEELPAIVERRIVETLKRWRFRPARTEEGDPVAVDFRLAVNVRPSA